MYLRELRIRNFKSIRAADIEFTPLTLVVGANAAGKSNLISVFRFLSDILTQGIDTAVALQGGMEFLKNAALPRGTPMEISLSLDLKNDHWQRIVKVKSLGSVAFSIQAVQYSFSICPHKRGSGYRIDADALCIAGELRSRDHQPIREGEEFRAALHFQRKKSASVHRSVDLTCPEPFREDIERSLRADSMYAFFTEYVERAEKEMLFSFISMLFPPTFIEESFIRIFDFDPKELKSPCPIASAPALQEDGSNLPAVLKAILGSRKSSRELTALLRDYLPFIERVAVESNVDRSYSYKVQENYNRKFFPEAFLSDGTASILALLIVFYFQDQTILIVEEPERNLHPMLLSNLLASAEDVSSRKQVILTTHNPEFLKYANIAHVLLASRDQEGFTIYTRPKDSEAVQTFIRNDLGLEDLFLQDMLGA